jgi:hypothetical protein
LIASLARLLTPRQPGAIAIIEVCGDVQGVCTGLDLTVPNVGALQLATIPDIDTALLARPDEARLHIMPHGGPWIVELISRRLTALGVPFTDRDAWPEADDTIEAAVMAAAPAASTSLALDLLMQQPARWRSFQDAWTSDDEARSTRLRHLLHPPRVVLAGPANIGKSTLFNTLAGRQRAAVHDAPGTTRDWVGARLDLSGLVVDWSDTPGLRAAAAQPEAEAIARAASLCERADLLIAAADSRSNWPELPRAADLQIALRSDLGERRGADVQCSATLGRGIDDVVATVRAALVPQADLACERPWRFDADMAPPRHSPIDE